MPKDYQEITHKILANLELVLMDKSIDGSDIADIWERFKPTLELILTTYGNARELQGVEKVEEGVPAYKPTDDSTKKGYNFGVDWERDMQKAVGSNSCRQATLDHIEKVKQELN